jgi:hypothetical protein
MWGRLVAKRRGGAAAPHANDTSDVVGEADEGRRKSASKVLVFENRAR